MKSSANAFILQHIFYLNNDMNINDLIQSLRKYAFLWVKKSEFLGSFSIRGSSLYYFTTCTTHPGEDSAFYQINISRDIGEKPQFVVISQLTEKVEAPNDVTIWQHEIDRLRVVESEMIQKEWLTFERTNIRKMRSMMWAYVHLHLSPVTFCLQVGSSILTNCDVILRRDLSYTSDHTQRSLWLPNI